MSELFTMSMITTLRTQYATVKTIDPDGQACGKMCKLLDSMTDNQLMQVKEANIKWLSSLAINRCISRGLI